MAFKMNNPLKHMGYKVKIEKGKVISEEERPHSEFKPGREGEAQHEEYHDKFPSKPFTDAEGRPLKKFKLDPPFPPGQGKKPHAYPSNDGKSVKVEGVEFTVIKKELEPGVAGEANNDGTIFVDHNIKENTVDEAEVIVHEAKHMKDMQEGILDYTDDHVTYKGKKYPRKDGYIKYNGKWVEEGNKNFPWEKRAYKAADAALKKIKNGK